MPDRLRLSLLFDGGQASYGDGIFEIYCPDCDFPYIPIPMPPSAFETADLDRGLADIDQDARQETVALSTGGCPICATAVDATFVPGDALWLESLQRLAVMFRFTCNHCGHRHFMTVGNALLYDHEGIAFFADHDRDITSTPQWELEFAVTDSAPTNHERDPWWLTFRGAREGDAFERELDGADSIFASGRG